MKKNKMMRLSVVLLMAFLLTLGMVGGTWAKYVSSETQSETVTVAKWGVTVAATEVNTKIYQSGVEVEDAVIKLDATTKLIAPGFEAKFCEFEVTGIPEVASKITYSATLTIDEEEWTAAGAEYCPLVFTVNGTDYKIEADDPSDDDEEITSISALIIAVQNAIAEVSDEFEAEEGYTEAASLEVSCSWAFAVEGNDAKDTELANKTTLPTVELSITCSVEQIDELA